MVAVIGAFAVAGPAAPVSGATAYTVTASASPSPVMESHAYTVTGSVSPAAAGAKVQLQQYTSGAWHTVASATLSTASTYTFNRTAPADPAVLRLRVHKAAANGVGAGNAASTEAVTSTELSPGQELTAGSFLVSADDAQYELIMQADGNLVEYVDASKRALWSSKTAGHSGAYVIMQTDGNLVVYSSGGTALWSSGTSGHAGSYLLVQDDANLVVYPSGGGTAEWASYSFNPTLRPGETLTAGQKIYSNGEKYDLTMQSDGNLVEYARSNGTAIWNSHTAGHPGAWAIMQTDGNLVVYASSTALWSSDTAGNSGAFLAIESDADMVVYATGGSVIWSSNSGQTGAIALQLPWPTGDRHDQSNGYSYGCGDHTGFDHYAIDFNLSYARVSAVAPGIVHEFNDGNSDYGMFIIIDHGDGMISLYGHLSQFKVSNGAYVTQGQEIAISGSTGNSTGAHLHFVIRKGASAVTKFAGTSFKPEPMSGYTGFGSYGLHNPPACTNTTSPLYTSSPPG